MGRMTDVFSRMMPLMVSQPARSTIKEIVHIQEPDDVVATAHETVEIEPDRDIGMSP